jgi:ribose transport system permease protein
MKITPRLTSTHIVYLVVLLTIIAGTILVAAAGRSFFSAGNVSSILTGTSVLGFIAIGQTLVILVGSLDLSVPYVVSLSSLLAAGIMANQPANILPGVLVALAVAAVIGLINGLVVSGLKVHGFIATLGTGLIISGYLATNYKGSSGQAPLSFRLVGATGLGPVPISTLIMLACAAVVLLVLDRTRLGHSMYAVGGDINVARMSGIRTSTPHHRRPHHLLRPGRNGGTAAGCAARGGQPPPSAARAATTCSPSPPSSSAAPCWPAGRDRLWEPSEGS